jgi:hypothetical protein
VAVVGEELLREVAAADDSGESDEPAAEPAAPEASDAAEASDATSDRGATDDDGADAAAS